jgi:hypothetical protein
MMALELSMRLRKGDGCALFLISKAAFLVVAYVTKARHVPERPNLRYHP